MRFPYVVFPAKSDAAFPNRRLCARPLIKVLLRKGPRSLLTYAIVDSGADQCIFPASLATHLGITIPNPNTYVFSGTQDSPQIAYFDTVTATLWNWNPAEAVITFELYAGFCQTLEHVGLGLLGQDGFFSRFTVNFDSRNLQFDVSA